MNAPGISFGQLRLSTPLLLSPLAGYTNLPFRRVIRELGSVGLCTTDLVNARSLLEKNHKALNHYKNDGKPWERQAADDFLSEFDMSDTQEAVKEARKL